jgi:hypothetical protein
MKNLRGLWSHARFGKQSPDYTNHWQQDHPKRRLELGMCINANNGSLRTKPHATLSDLERSPELRSIELLDENLKVLMENNSREQLALALKVEVAKQNFEECTDEQIKELGILSLRNGLRETTICRLTEAKNIAEVGDYNTGNKIHLLSLISSIVVALDLVSEHELKRNSALALVIRDLDNALQAGGLNFLTGLVHAKGHLGTVFSAVELSQNKELVRSRTIINEDYENLVLGQNLTFEKIIN